MRNVLLVSLLAAGLTGCSKPQSEDTAGTVRIQIPLQTSQGNYSLETVSIEQLESLRAMQGAYAQFFLSPKLVPGGLEGSPFQGRYANMKDRWVPRDVVSLTAATVYYHLQELWKLDASVGASELKPRQQQVALDAIIEEDGERLQNNALFDMLSKALLFVNYTANNMPVSVNSGILAHEHFHSLFAPLVLEPLSNQGFFSEDQDDLSKFSNIFEHARITHMEKENSLQSIERKDTPFRRRLIYHLIWLKGINEGLADVWGWAYTWDPEFIALSLPSEREFRSLKATDAEPFHVTSRLSKSASAIAGLSSSDHSQANQITSLAYLLGTEWARLFKQYLDQSLESTRFGPESNLEARQAPNSPTRLQARQEILQAIIASLTEMRDELLAMKEAKRGEVYNPSHLLMSFSRRQKNQTEASCKIIADYLSSMPKMLNNSSLFSDTSIAKAGVSVDQKFLCQNLSSENPELGFQPQEVNDTKNSDDRQ